MRVKKMKTKWGSCNPESGRIWINLELIKKPKKHLEYVVVHELIHLLEPSHNENFVRLLQRYFPQWEKYRTELNEMVL